MVMDAPSAAMMADRLRALTIELMLIPGLSGHEDRVRRAITKKLISLGLTTKTDRLGNLMATLAGDPGLPSVMVFAHMDQLGLIVRKIETNGLIRVERLGGVPERALASQSVLMCVGEGRDVPGLISNKSHHATGPDEKYKVLPYADIAIDAGFSTADGVIAAGIDVGTPIVYEPKAMALADGRIAGTSVDDRAGCAVMIVLAELLLSEKQKPTTHFVFAVQEEFNLQGAVTAARALAPEIAIQLDLILATDTPEMAGRGDVRLGAGPAMSLYSFHGRGTLNGTIPHPALTSLFAATAKNEGLMLQRSAHVGALTDSSYVQLLHEGIASIDLGFPCRYTHSSLEMCDPRDLASLTHLLVKGIVGIDMTFTLDRDHYT
jgi:putative aminopeptidase FrvX